MRVKNSKILLFTLFFVSFFLIAKSADAQLTSPQLVSPENGSTDQPVSLILEWNQILTADEYNVQVAADDEFNDPEIDITTTDTTTLIEDLLHQTTYHWRVRSSTFLGTISGWSETWSFTTEEEPLAPPETPTPVSPDNSQTGVSINPTLEWNEADRAEAYSLQAATDADFDNLIADETGVTATEFQLSGLNFETTYHWRIMASNQDGDSDWSETWSFTTEEEPLNPPETPTLASPDDNETGVSTNPVLQWEESAGAETYTLHAATDADFDNLIAEEAGITSTEFQLNGLDFEATYHWRIMASSQDGESDWSETRSFTTEEEPLNPPETPTLASPDDGETGVSTNPVLQWEESAGAETYTLHAATDEDFDSLVVDQSEITATEFQLNGLVYETTYYWRISAVNDVGESNWSEARNFTTMQEPLAAPGSPEQVSPIDGADGLPVTITFEWEEVLLAESYHLQVALERNFDTLAANRTGLDSPSETVEGLDYETTYHWRVRSVNAAGESNWSDIWSFTTEDTPLEKPESPTLASPANGSMDVSTTPTMEWNHVEDADNYTIQLAKENPFDEVVIEENTGSTGIGLSGLEYDTQYFWRVRTSNETGNSSWSQIWSFTTEQASSDITLLKPQYGTIWTSNETEAIEWETTNNNINTVRISYSTDNGDTWSTITEGANASDFSYIWQLPDTSATNARIKIEDSDDEDVFWISDPFIIYPATVNLSINYSFSQEPSSSDYRLIGLPAQTNLPADQLFSGVEGHDWRIYFDNGAPSDYLVEYDGSEQFNFQPGRAFWIISRESVEFNEPAETVPLAEDSTFTIPLHPGWNIISNPFDRFVSWNSVQEKNDVMEPIWEFEGEFIQSSRLEPYKGYYIYNAHELEELKIPYISNDTATKKHLISENNSFISVSVYKDGAHQTAIQIGFDPSKVNEDDKIRYKAPPGDFLDYYLTLTDNSDETNNRHGHYVAEIGREPIDHATYDLQLKATKKAPIQFKVEGLQNLAGNGVYLLSNSTGRSYDLHTGDSPPITAGEGSNSYTLVIGSEQALEEVKNRITPETFTLAQNYPNPFNNQTVIDYSIPESVSNQQVLLEVFDIQGRRVSTIVNERQQAGFYTVNWNADYLASGVYIYRLRVGSFIKIQKMTLLQ